MIHVERRDEPPAFEQNVRRPGLRALAESRMPDYWRRCTVDLAAAYDRICAYLCILIPSGTVDHFVPKSLRPELAYEWSNFRFADATINSRKGNSQDVLDPFEVENGWFQLVFPTCLVRPQPDLAQDRQQQVRLTIERLRLNESRFLAIRRQYYRMHQERLGLPMAHLERLCPFVALELRRQGKATKEARDA